MSEDDIVAVVDECADALMGECDDGTGDRIVREANRLGLTAEELLHRISVEVLARIA